MKILFLAPYPLDEAPSQRFRFEHFLDVLKEHQVEWHFQSFLTLEAWTKLYTEGKSLRKFWYILSGFGRRKLMLLSASKYDYVFIHRELTPFGPPIFEWILAKVFKKKIIYDFDDAIWLADKHENPLWRWSKWRSKVSSICKWSWKVSAGNEFLADYARQYCQPVEVLPTVVDTTVHKPIKASRNEKRICIGWTGSHSTLFYLDHLVPILEDLENDYDFDFLVIANKNPKLPLKNFRFMPWSRETEIEDLAQIDIGVMPLTDNAWAKGKCGFKLIQYLALEIPAVASPVGVNTNIIRQDQNSFLASNPEEWKNALSKLLVNSDLRKKMGIKGRALVEKQYSLQSQKVQFIGLFQ